MVPLNTRKKKGKKTQPSFIIYSLKTHVNMSNPPNHHPPPRRPPDGQSFCWQKPVCSEETVQHRSNTQHQRSIYQPPPPFTPPPFHPTSPSGAPPCLKDDTVYPGWVPREKQIVVLFFCSNRTEQQVACLSLTRIIKSKDAGWRLWLMSHESSASSAHQTAA